MAKNSSEVILSFGLITDIQFADRDDGYDYLKISKRYYRNALSQLETTIQYWNNQSKNNVEFFVQLGDLIDGYNHKNGQEKEALLKVLTVISTFPGIVHHVWGNHEFYNFSVEQLSQSTFSLNSSKNTNCKSVPGKGYYSFMPREGLKILILNCYELNIIDKSGPNYERSFEICKVNPNDDRNDSRGMDASTFMMVAYNGGIGQSQLQWLEQCLQESDQQSQNVIICGHIPVYNQSCGPRNVCWDSLAVLDVLHQHKCIITYLAGHDHDGGSAIDDKGIYHITMPGIIETSPDEKCFATVELCPDTLYIHGQGKMNSFEIPLKYPIRTKT